MNKSGPMSENTLPNPPSPTEKRSLIVIGAGMAGMKLAHTCLTQQQQKEDPIKMNIIILEANGYIGGRVRNMKVFADNKTPNEGGAELEGYHGYTVEMGANWISGLESTYDNPIWKLAKQVSLKGHSSDRTDNEAIQALDRHGNDVTEDYMKAVEKFEQIFEKAIQACADQKITAHNDIGVQSFLYELGWGKDEPLTSIEKLAEYNILEVWISDGLEELSTAHNMEKGANDVDLGQEEFFVEDQRGFNCIMNSMANDIQQCQGVSIRLNTQVEKVEYAIQSPSLSSSSSLTEESDVSPTAVKVTARDLETGEVTEYYADAVVSTVSIGVLKEEKIEFVPPFPKWKVDALNEIDMFVFAKVYVKFQKNCIIASDQITFCTDKKGYYPLWMKYRSAPPDHNYFMCYLGGSEAKRVESLTKDQIKDEVEELFGNAFQKQTESAGAPSSIASGNSRSIFRPLDVAVTDWSRNPRFCGSYSCLPVNAYASVPRKDLTRGLAGTPNHKAINLYFAGEGFDDKFNGWVQGAYRSGERVAKEILGGGL